MCFLFLKMDCIVTLIWVEHMMTIAWMAFIKGEVSSFRKWWKWWYFGLNEKCPLQLCSGIWTFGPQLAALFGEMHPCRRKYVPRNRFWMHIPLYYFQFATLPSAWEEMISQLLAPASVPAGVLPYHAAIMDFYTSGTTNQNKPYLL